MNTATLSPRAANVKAVSLVDRQLLWVSITIIALGLVMVTSASMVIAERQTGFAYHYVLHQAAYLLLGLMAAGFVLRIEIQQWQKLSFILLLVSVILLTAVLIPGLGRSVNGSRRWIGLGPIGMQVSELAKLFVIVYISDYLVRRQDEIRTQMSGFIKPMMVLGLIALLLLCEPDFGSTTVLLATCLGLMFLAGVRLWQFAVLFSVVLAGLAGLAISSPYRMARLTTFLDPWSRQFDSGYQLTQSLIAFGRGGWSGVGLGESIQKLFYLPEAHTDFLFAVLSEELGLIGIVVVMLLYAIVVIRALKIGRAAILREDAFSGYFAYGLGLWVGLQSMINLGVNSGLLPTKGLTLPLISYGGSSLVVMVVVIAILLRIDYENRLTLYGLQSKRRRRR